MSCTERVATPRHEYSCFTTPTICTTIRSAKSMRQPASRRRTSSTATSETSWFVPTPRSGLEDATQMTEQLAGLRKRLAVTAAAVALGIALSTSVDQTLGGWITVGGVAALVLTLHRFGRTGPS